MIVELYPDTFTVSATGTLEELQRQLRASLGDVDRAIRERDNATLARLRVVPA